MLIYDTIQFQEAKLKRPPLPHKLLEQTHKRKVDNQFFDRKSQEIYVSAKFLVNFCLYFLSSEKYIINVYMFQNHVITRYEAETATAKDDASSSQAINATQIYLDEVRGI